MNISTCVCMLRSFSDGDSDGDHGDDDHGDHDGGDGDGDRGDGGVVADGDDGGVGVVGDAILLPLQTFSSYLAQFSVPTACRYTHPAHVRAAHSAVQDDPLYSALSQLEDLAGMP